MARQHNRESVPVEPELVDSTASENSLSLLAVSRTEIDMQIATAKKYPRDLEDFRETLEEAVTHSDEIAGECSYRLERKDKDGTIKVIEGPSVRFAEVVMSLWGNCRAGARVIEEGQKFVVAQGVFIDLQRNVSVTLESRRRITGSSGRRYGDDMIGTTANAACSIALRNAITRGVPKVYWESAYEATRKKLLGRAADPKARQTMIEYFAKLGVSAERVLAAVGRQAVAEITAEDLVRLRGFATAVKDGEATIEEMFPDPGKTVQTSDSRQLEVELANEAAQKQPEATPAGGSAPHPEEPPVAAAVQDPEPELPLESESAPAEPSEEESARRVTDFKRQVRDCTSAAMIDQVVAQAAKPGLLTAKDLAFLKSVATNCKNRLRGATTPSPAPAKPERKGPKDLLDTL